jgi:hypothetical protein
MSTARVVHSEKIAKILRKIPLKTRLRITNEMLIHSYLIDIGYIPDGPWTDEKEEKYGKSFRKFAKELTAAQLNDFEKWEEDGRPK